MRPTERLPLPLVNRLTWLAPEIDISLNRVRLLIDQQQDNAVEDFDPATILAELRTVLGALQMAQCIGGSLLVAELCEAVATTGGQSPRAEETLAAVSGATLQLSDYLDALRHGIADRAAVLQPVISEVRLACGRPAISESELFARQMRVLAPDFPLPPQPTRAAGAAAALAGKLLPMFQGLLLQWLRGNDATNALLRLRKIGDHIANHAVVAEVVELWMFFAAAVDSLLAEPKADALELKRGFGRVGQQIKLMAEQGEIAAAAEAPDIAWRLLAQAAVIHHQGERWAWLKQVLPLADTLPIEPALSAMRKRLRGPNTQLLEKVAEEVRVDLTRVKDALDLALRAGGLSAEGQTSMRDNLGRIASTLSLLGLPQLEQVLLNQSASLGDLATSDSESEGQWMRTATALLRVEHSLESALFRPLRQMHGETPDELVMSVPHTRDLREGAAALLREMLVDLAKVKAQLDVYLKGQELRDIREPLNLLREVSAGFGMLDLQPAAGMVHRLGEWLATEGIIARLREDKNAASAFAEAVAVLELYIEARRDGLPQIDEALGRLPPLLETLSTFLPGEILAPAGEIPAQESGVPVLPEPPPETAAEVPAVSLPESPVPVALADVDDSVQAPSPAEVPPAPAAQEGASTQPAGDDDPEIRAIFIEEAQDVRDGLRRSLSAFHRDTTDLEVLGGIRRAFHTLKGSGRMVGAEQIGEFARSIEHLLNRCIEGALPVNAAVVAVVDKAVDRIPDLLEAFQQGHDADAETQALVARAHYLASGRAPEMVEAEVLEVFRADAIDRLADVERWLHEDATLPVDPDAVRAMHTLKGAAAVVNAESLSALAGSIEGVLKYLRNAERPAPAEVRAVFVEVLPVLRDWVAQTGHREPHDGSSWLARVEALRAFLPPPTETRGQTRRETLVNLAFDRLQILETRLHAWMAQAHDAVRGADTADAAEALFIVSEDCRPLARGAEAMMQRLRALQAGQVPDAGFFQTLIAALERFYQFLDAHREGGARDGGQDLVASLLALQVAPAAAAVSEAPPTVLPPLPSLLDDPEAPDEVAPVSPTMDLPTTSAMPESLPPLVVEAASPASVETSLLIEVPSIPPPTHAGDAELVEIFVTEARELLAEAKPLLEEWPGIVPPPAGLVRVLHTMAGSARMAGYTALGDVAHGFEGRLLRLDPVREGVAVRQALQALLPDMSVAVDQFADVAMRQALAFSFGPVSEPMPEKVPESAPELDVAPSLLGESLGNLSSPLLQPLPSLIDGMENIWLDASGAALGAPVQRSVMPKRREAAPAEIPAPDAAGTTDSAEIDPELANIFIAEATEMLETIDSTLSDWRKNAGDENAIRELQRALHTLKGGARMTGFGRMGDVTHDMESCVTELLAQGGVPSEADHAKLKVFLETLERMHDALSRGHYAETVRVAQMDSEMGAASLGDEPVDYGEARSQRPLATPESLPVGWDPALFWRPDEDVTLSTARRELARVPVETLDTMLNEAGEISIFRSRLEQQNAALQTQLVEMTQTIVRLREQLRLMDIETEAQIAARGFTAQGADQYGQDFDPLEMDRYSRMQELSRALAEAVGDLGSLHLSMDQGVNETQALLQQQGRVNTTVQQGLMGTLMVPFSRQVARLQRVVRQTAQEENKFADVSFSGVESELDRNVLERMTAPLEHLLRNAVVHGLESADERVQAGKPPMGTVQVLLRREGTQLVMEIGDDGRGLNFAAIRRKAIERGLMPADADLADDEVARFIFETGFSTADALTQSAGRGVGMDVVASEVKQLGGVLELRSEPGKGTRFLIRLPLSLALSQVLMVQVGDETYALPLAAIDGIARVPRAVAAAATGDAEAEHSYAGHRYRVRYLAELIDLPYVLPEDARTVPAVLVRLGEGIGGGERRAALLVDQLMGNREIVSKAVGPQLSSISGVSGATILPNGLVVLILDPAALIVDRARRRLIAEAAAAREAVERQDEQLGRLVMVVDDSVTMRRVAERLLQRNGYRVITAKDGLDAIGQLHTEMPAAILLDIEMPRADGFEVAGFIRNNDRIRETPIIMITSRSGDKHRARAAALGVNRYLIKPYQEEHLLQELRSLLQAREAEVA